MRPSPQPIDDGPLGAGGDLVLDQATLEAARRVRDAVAARSSASLVRASALLGSAKRRLFDAAYLAMRIVDDEVDALAASGDPSALRAGDERLAQRMTTLERALDGAAAPAAPSLFDDACRLLGALEPRTRLGLAPWREFASAMRDDLARAPMRDWADFDRYAAGASHAPTALFLTILGADRALRLHAGGYEAMRDRSAPLGAFCYLGHIARDLERDAATGGRALTLPDCAYEEADVDPAGLDASALEALRVVIGREALRREEAVASALEALDAVLGRLEAKMTRFLVDHYGAYAKNERPRALAFAAL